MFTFNQASPQGTMPGVTSGRCLYQETATPFYSGGQRVPQPEMTFCPVVCIPGLCPPLECKLPGMGLYLFHISIVRFFSCSARCTVGNNTCSFSYKTVN